MKQKITPPEDLKINDGIQLVDKKGNEIKISDGPNILGTKAVYLSRSKPIQPINMFLPPGVSKFYVERLDKNHIRFLIKTDEVERLAEKVEKIMEATKNAKENN